MKYYTSTTEFNCGIDLHARQMYVCVMDRQGKKLVHANIKGNDFEFFLGCIHAYRHSLMVCCECMFGWYWLADACQSAGLTFVLAHALYLKAIHGGKHKNDRIDSETLAHLLRSNLIPPAYVYPAEKRPLRALLRQRIGYVWRRTELLNPIQSHQLAHNRPSIRCTTRYNRDPWEKLILETETHPLRQLALQTDMAMVQRVQQLVSNLGILASRASGYVKRMIRTLKQPECGAGSEPCAEVLQKGHAREFITSSLQEQHRNLDFGEMFCALVGRLPGGVKREPKKHETAHAGQRRRGLRLRSHTAAKGFPTGQQGKLRNQA